MCVCAYGFLFIVMVYCLYAVCIYSAVGLYVKTLDMQVHIAQGKVTWTAKISFIIVVQSVEESITVR